MQKFETLLQPLLVFWITAARDEQEWKNTLNSGHLFLPAAKGSAHTPLRPIILEMEDDLKFIKQGRWSFITSKSSLLSPILTWAWHSSASACYIQFLYVSLSPSNKTWTPYSPQTIWLYSSINGIAKLSSRRQLRVWLNWA